MKTENKQPRAEYMVMNPSGYAMSIHPTKAEARAKIAWELKRETDMVYTIFKLRP